MVDLIKKTCLEEVHQWYTPLSSLVACRVSLVLLLLFLLYVTYSCCPRFLHTPPSPFQEALGGFSWFLVPAESSPRAVSWLSGTRVLWKGPAQECSGQRSVNRWSLSIIWHPLYTHKLCLQLSFSMSMCLTHKHRHTQSPQHSTIISFLFFFESMWLFQSYLPAVCAAVGPQDHKAASQISPGCLFFTQYFVQPVSGLCACVG